MEYRSNGQTSCQSQKLHCLVLQKFPVSLHPSQPSMIGWIRRPIHIFFSNARRPTKGTLITMLSTSFVGRGIVRTVGRIADSNRAQTLERHRSLHAVLFASRRVWLRVTKRAFPGKAPARSIFKLVFQGGIPNVFKNRENSSFKPQHFPAAKFRIAFQRHGGAHHRSRPGAN
jgi:hypothetical protein